MLGKIPVDKIQPILGNIMKALNSLISCCSEPVLATRGIKQVFLWLSSYIVIDEVVFQ